MRKGSNLWQQNIFEYRKPMGIHTQNTTAVADSDSDSVKLMKVMPETIIFVK